MKRVILFFIATLFIHTSGAEELSLDSLFSKTKELEGESKVDEMLALANRAIKTKPGKSIEWSGMALEEAKAISYDRGIANAMYILAYSHRMLGQTNFSFPRSLEALKIFTDLNDSLSMAAAAKLVALNYEAVNFPGLAVKHLRTAANIYDFKDMDLEEANAWYNIGLLYFDMYRPNVALDMIDDSWNIYDSLGLKVERARCELLAAKCYEMIDSPELVLGYYDDALYTFRAEKANEDLIDLYLHRANYLGAKAELELWKEDLDSAYSIANQMGRRSLILRCLDSALVFHQATSNWEQLIGLAEQALGLSELENCYECGKMESAMLARAYAEVGRHKDIYAIMRLYQHLSNKAAEAKLNEEKEALGLAIHADKQERELFNLDEMIKVVDGEANIVKRNPRLFIFGGILLMSIVLVFGLKRFK